VYASACIRAGQSILSLTCGACDQARRVVLLSNRSSRTMNRLFGTAKPQAPKPTLQDTTVTMERRLGSLDQKIMEKDKELARYTGQMSKMKPGPAKQSVHKRAMMVLKQKKMYESQKEKTMAQQFNIEQIACAQESLETTVETVRAWKAANMVLTDQINQINVNEVDDLQDDMVDLLEQAEEIQSAMGASYNTDHVDEADLEAELAAMEDDPSLFSDRAGLADYSTDYLDLPATSSEPLAVPDQPVEEERMTPSAQALS